MLQCAIDIVLLSSIDAGEAIQPSRGRGHGVLGCSGRITRERRSGAGLRSPATIPGRPWLFGGRIAWRAFGAGKVPWNGNVPLRDTKAQGSRAPRGRDVDRPPRGLASLRSQSLIGTVVSCDQELVLCSHSIMLNAIRHVSGRIPGQIRYRAPAWPQRRAHGGSHQSTVSVRSLCETGQGETGQGETGEGETGEGEAA